MASDLMDGKVCLVTGATNGIGRVAARELAKMGAVVVIVGRNPARTEATVHEITSQTGSSAVDSIVADLSSMAEVRRGIGVPLMADESVRTVRDAMEVIRRGAADIANVYVTEAGGLLNASRIFTLCEAAGIGVISYYGLAKGFLTGKYRSEADLGKSPRGEGVRKYLEPRGQLRSRKASTPVLETKRLVDFRDACGAR